MPLPVGKRAGAGIGGFWLPPSAGDLSQAKWFSIQLSASDLPVWLRGNKASGLQGVVAGLEAVAQLVLVVLRIQCSGPLPGGQFRPCAVRTVRQRFGVRIGV